MKYDINKDYYAILGLDSTASKEEINEAIDNYINVITKSDSINFAKDATTTIVEVMNVLKNPEVKKEYDLAKGFITEKAIEEKDNDINDDE
jgi:DnaJ-class molecular chaperone